MLSVRQHPNRPLRWLARALAAAMVTAAVLGANAGAAHASGKPDAADVAIVFTVSDAESAEAYILVEDPTCPPDIICKPRRAPGQITFLVSTNVSLCCQDLTVEYETYGGTATPDVDYCKSSGKVTFGRGEFVKPVKVCVHFNTAVEPTEFFHLRLKNPNVAADVTDEGTATILDGIEYL